MQAAEGSQLYGSSLELHPFVPLEWGSYAARILISGERLFDFLAIVAAMYVANTMHSVLHLNQARTGSSSTILLTGAVAGVVFIFLLERHGGYRPFSSLLSIRETERLLRVTTQTFILISGAVYLFSISVPKTTMICGGLLAAACLLVEKWRIHTLLCRLRSRGYATQKAVILGTGSAARRIYTSLLQSPKFGIEPVAFLDPDDQSDSHEIYPCSYRRSHAVPVVHVSIEDALFRFAASTVILCQPDMDEYTRQSLLSEAAELGVSAYFLPQEPAAGGCQLDYTDVDGIVLAHASKSRPRPLFETGKRVLDFAVACAGLLFLALLTPLIALLVKRSSPGPVFFRQQRVGRNGRRFTIYKFRTMYVDAPQYSCSPGQEVDERVTPVGRFLRHTSLDELPQLINVLLGQMSLVGPRPEMPFIVEQYTPEQRQRLALKPGITGLWQISADRAFPIHQNLEYDAYYAQHRSFFMDLAILLHSFPFAARGT